MGIWFMVVLILSLSSLLRPLPYDPAFNVDLGLLAGGTLLLLVAMYTGRRMRIDRWEALLLLASYMVYLSWMLGGYGEH